MSKPVTRLVLVRPNCTLGPASYGDLDKLARLTGRLSGLVDEQLGLTPTQLADLVQLLDKFLGLVPS